LKSNSIILDKFIVLEGLDGSGTTTQAQLLFHNFKKESIPSRVTAEPTDLPAGKLLRNILKGEIKSKPETVALLFAADRYEHVFAEEFGINDAVNSGNWIISDRYLFSSMAYQSVQCDFEWVRQLNSIFPLPQYLFYLDVPVDDCSRRISRREQEELYDRQEFQSKVKKRYEMVLEFFAHEDMKIIRIDGRQNPNDIAEEIWSYIPSKPTI
jgi:dTMP kinase